MATEMAGRIMAIPTCWRLMVWCARCGRDYVQDPQHVGSSYALDGDTAQWRRYLAGLGWTENGTVCLTCSKSGAVSD